MRIPYLFYRVCSFPHRQIIHVLPRNFWDRVSVFENGESMVELQQSQKLVLKPLENVLGTGTSFRVRKSVAEKLFKASECLPDGFKLAIIEGYRSLEKQKNAWDRKWGVVRNEHPDWSDERVDQEVRLVVARPVGITNHVCGGAVDVALVGPDGVFLDFGTPYAPAEESLRRKVSMFAQTITVEQKINRRILREAMEFAGFVWYPGEWWHYCYGDRMWAVYTGQTKCFYGPVETEHS
jgi:zinc D-Ala-D-Ala dipeptidase